MSEPNLVTWRGGDDAVYGSNGAQEEMDLDPIIDRPQVTKVQLRRVFWLNIVAFIVQALAGGAQIGLTDPDKKYLVYSNFPQQAPVDSNGNIPPGVPIFGPAFPKELFGTPVGYLSAAFLLLSAIDHFIVFTVGKGSYETGLENGYNVYRWLEYSMSASIMRVMVALLSGVSDIHMLFLIAGLTACTMLFGLVFELENSNRQLDQVRWTSFWIAFIPHFFSWSVIFCYFFVQISRGGDTPDFVWSIIFIIFALDFSFAIALFLQWRGKGCCFKYISGEIGFIILSLTSKQLLAWINFFGGNR